VPKKIWTYLGYLLLVPSILFGAWQWQENNKIPETYIVRNVLDGDTIVIEDGVKIKLSNLDAPELERCGGKEAKAFLESLIKDKNVGIKILGIDVYKRPLAWVYQNGKLINESMIESGWADFDTSGRSSEIKEKLKELYQTARKEKIGIFGKNCLQQINEDKPNCLIKGNISAYDGKQYYHFPGCSNYESANIELFHGDQWFCSEKEAVAAGFVKSKNCFDKKFTPGL